MTTEAKLLKLFDRFAGHRSVHSLLIGIDAPGIEFREAAGHADGIGRTPVTKSTPFFLASTTKLFTSVAVMRLRRDGRIDLDAPVTTHLDRELVEGLHVIDGTDHTDEITLFHLLSQTSGLGDYFSGKVSGSKSFEADLLDGNDRALTLEEILDMARMVGPEFPPGDQDGGRAHYCDTNFQLLGAVIENVTGEPLTTTFEELIFQPLGLSSTYIYDHTQDQPPPAVLWNGGRSVHIPLAMSSFAPDGGGVTTLSDAMRFTKALFNGELLTPQELTFMTSRWNKVFFPFEYGVGIQRFRMPRFISPFGASPLMVGHAGSTGSFCFHHAETQAFIVGTANQTDNPGRPYRTILQMLGALS